ncbi:hypothetical protein E4U36_005672 [Claviceps purpurea]|nr:hypothetical protein E4U36_005672 [Claviceps purpurea]
MNLLYGALMQIYDYMVRSFSSFGMLTTGTGEAIVFLYIDWSSDEKTLYYHVARPGEPAADVKGAPYDLKEAAFRLAVGQLQQSLYPQQQHLVPSAVPGLSGPRSQREVRKGSFRPDGIFICLKPGKGLNGTQPLDLPVIVQVIVKYDA